MQNVVGIFETRTEAEKAIQRLKESGVAPEAISIAMKDVRESSDLLETTGAQDLSAEGATAGAVSGAAVGTLIGLAMVGSTFVLPGLGTFLVGGPLAAALAGAGIGAASGGLLGALIGSGIPEVEAEHYAAGIEKGHILISTSVADTEAPNVRKIFDEEGSHRTHSVGI
jgi:Heat induced stress protein YflT